MVYFYRIQTQILVQLGESTKKNISFMDVYRRLLENGCLKKPKADSGVRRAHRAVNEEAILLTVLLLFSKSSLLEENHLPRTQYCK